MINVISITNFFITPVATAFLPIVLVDYVLLCMGTISVFSAGAAISHYSSPLYGIAPSPIILALMLLFSIIVIIFTRGFFATAGVSFTPPSRCIAAQFSRTLKVSITPCLICSVNLFSIVFVVRFAPRLYTFFAIRAKSVRRIVLVKVFSRSREFLTALRTGFHRGIHSASRSLSRRVARQAVRVTAPSGATLDAVNNYTR